MPITALPTPPLRSDGPATFADNGDVFMAALPTFATEANALEANVEALEAAAEVSSNAAVAATNSIKWISGTTYAIGDVRWSPANSLSYRRRTTGAGTTDPASDATNWAQLVSGVPLQSGHAGKVLGTDGTNATWRVNATVQEFAASGTWTKPAGAQTVLVEAWAGGAGGANTTGTTGYANGGSGGEFVAMMFEAADLAATETVVVGSGGAGGANASNISGADGGNSTFGSVLTARGGNAGFYHASAPFLIHGFINTGTSVTRADQILETLGEPQAARGIGGVAFSSVTTSFGGASVNGGGGGGAARGTSINGAAGLSSYGGNGGAGVTTSATKGGNGVVPGGGGGGSSQDGGGGNGAAGRVRVWTW